MSDEPKRKNEEIITEAAEAILELGRTEAPGGKSLARAIIRNAVREIQANTEPTEPR